MATRLVSIGSLCSLGPLNAYERHGSGSGVMARRLDSCVAHGSSVVADPCEGHISVMIPYVVYRKLAWFL